jgi:hypothetical protein
MSLFQELKRRNVIRIAILYLVSSWVLLQLADVLSSLLWCRRGCCYSSPTFCRRCSMRRSSPGLSSSCCSSSASFLLVLGFFPALIFAWVYEMTPEGLKREVDVDRSQSMTPETGKKLNVVIIVLLVIAISGLVVDRLIPETSVE